MWDLFISHASEDKIEVVLPLVQKLEEYCLRVWIDRVALLPGHRLQQNLEEGIRNSHAGIVILSNHFFAKRWPKHELEYMAELVAARNYVLIPVWHCIDASTIAEYSKKLADIVAVSTGSGLDTVAEEIARLLDCRGKPLELMIDSETYNLSSSDGSLSGAIRASEDLPGSYTKRRIRVHANKNVEQRLEIERGIRFLITLKTLTFPVRDMYNLALCLSSFVNLYEPMQRAWSGSGSRIELIRDSEPKWYIGIYVTSEEEADICNILGVDQIYPGCRGGLLDLGTEVLAKKAIPKILFEFFRREQLARSDFSASAPDILSLSSWAFTT